MGCGLWVVGCGSRVEGGGLRVEGREWEGRRLKGDICIAIVDAGSIEDLSGSASSSRSWTMMLSDAL